MNTKKTTTFLATLCMAAAFLIVPLEKADAQMAIGIKGGSTGVGGEFTYSLNEKFNTRLSGTFFNYTHSGSYNDDDPGIDYDMDGSITSIS